VGARAEGLPGGQRKAENIIILTAHQNAWVTV
jgi:hypothetical protein